MVFNSPGEDPPETSLTQSSLLGYFTINHSTPTTPAGRQNARAEIAPIFVFTLIYFGKIKHA